MGVYGNCALHHSSPGLGVLTCRLRNGMYVIYIVLPIYMTFPIYPSALRVSDEAPIIVLRITFVAQRSREKQINRQPYTLSN